MAVFRDERGGGDEATGNFADELTKATRSLGNFDKTTQRTTKSLARGALGAVGAGAALVGAGVAKNTAARVGRQAVRAAGFDLTTFGVGLVATGGTAGTDLPGSFAYSAAKGLATNPMLSAAFKLDQTLKPFMTAGQRTLGITGSLARLGVSEGEIADIRGGVFKQFAQEEKRAAKEAKAVDKLVRSEFGDEALANVTAGLQELANIPQQIHNAIMAAARELWREIKTDMTGGAGGSGP